MEVKYTNCDISTVFNYLKDGYKAKRPGWNGHWFIKDGRVVFRFDKDEIYNYLTFINDINTTCTIRLTLENVSSKDWICFKDV